MKWITEILIKCDCDSSPEAAIWGGKTRHKHFICERCRVFHPERHDNNAFVLKYHYISLPEHLVATEVKYWMQNEGKQFLIGKEGLLKQQKKYAVTYTSEKQQKAAVAANQPVRPVEKFSVDNVAVLWYGFAAKASQMTAPTDDLTVHACYIPRTHQLVLKIQALRTIFTLGKDNGITNFKDLLKSKDPMFNVVFSVHICAKCGKMTNNSYNLKDKRTGCLNCFKEEDKHDKTKK